MVRLKNLKERIKGERNRKKKERKRRKAYECVVYGICTEAVVRPVALMYLRSINLLIKELKSRKKWPRIYTRMNLMEVGVVVEVMLAPSTSSTTIITSITIVHIEYLCVGSSVFVYVHMSAWDWLWWC